MGTILVSILLIREEFKMNNIAYIYRIINIINGMCYVGITRNRDVIKRWEEHLVADSKLGKAIRIYGSESFDYSVLEEHVNISDEKLFQIESEFIEKFNSINNGYNVVLSSKTVDKKTRHQDDFLDIAVEGIRAFQTISYYGKQTDCINNKVSFWKSLVSERLCFTRLLTENNYMTNVNSKYYKVLSLNFTGRKQRFFHIEYMGTDYVTDNLKSVTDLLRLTREKNESLPYKLVSYDIREDHFELTLDDEDSGTKRIKLYDTLLFDDELLYKERVTNVRDILKQRSEI